MYSLPSTSNRCEPSPRAMKMGCPPTLRNARTGEFTPPGITSTARRNSSSDLVCVIFSSCKCSALKSPFPALNSPRLGHDVAKPDAHGDLVQAAVQIAHQTALQPQVGLLTGEQILHHVGKSDRKSVV